MLFLLIDWINAIGQKYLNLISAYKHMLSVLSCMNFQDSVKLNERDTWKMSSIASYFKLRVSE